jgi:cephalosporin hydroxylase
MARVDLKLTELQLVKEYAEAAERYTFGTTMATYRAKFGYKIRLNLWKYQEILYDLRPNLVVEFGTQAGGWVLYFQTVMGQISQSFRVLTADVDHRLVDADLRREPTIEFMTCSSTEPQVAHTEGHVSIGTLQK